MKIIVTGSLGDISRPLTQTLVQEGHTVTVISSKPEKQKDIEALGAGAAIGSLQDADFLVAAFTGADAVFAMVPRNYAEPDQLGYYSSIAGNYAQAVQQSGVKRVVYLSSYGAHLDKGTGFILGAHVAEGILDRLKDAAVTHLRAGYFYYNLYSFTDMIKEQGFMGANYGGHDRLLLVAPADIAAAAAEELALPGTGRQVRYVASDERTASEVAAVLGAAIGKPGLKWETFTDEQLKNSMEQRGMPAHFVAGMVELGASLHSGRLYEQHVPGATGRIKLEDFAKEFALAFKKGVS